MNILVVESHGFVRGLLVDLLRLQGYAVRGVSNRSEALAALRQQPADCVIAAKGTEGIELLRELRSGDAALAATPCVLMSSDGDIEEIARKEGTVGYRKGSKTEILFEAIRSAIEARSRPA